MTAKSPEHKKLTLKEYLSNTPEGNFELINGVLCEPPSPTYGHQGSSISLSTQLFSYVTSHNLGVVLSSPIDVVFSENLVLQPDILFIANERKHIITENNIQGAPDLIVEIVSPSSIHHDTVFKKSIYEKYGVKEFWLVYPNEKTVDVFVLKKGIYTLRQTANENSAVESVVVKGLKIYLNLMF